MTSEVDVSSGPGARGEAPLVVLLDGPLHTGALSSGSPRLIVEFAEAATGITASGGERSPGSQHAMYVAQAMLAGGTDIRIANIAVFGERLSSSVEGIVEALETALSLAPDIVHCSFGLVREDPRMGVAIGRLIEQGVTVVASAPARGAGVWPAQYEGVNSVQGDARCAADQWSRLDLPGARFGACPRLAQRPQIGGASVAAGHFTGLLIAAWNACVGQRGAAAPRPESMLAAPAFVGRERR